MDDDLFDAEATRRVANRAVISAGAAFAGGVVGNIVPLAPLVIIPFLVIAVLVGISSIRTLNHPEAHVIGALRHVGIVGAAIGALLGAVGTALRIYVLVR
jgi:hypothetical protein